jgi:hypothetical protein
MEGFVYDNVDLENNQKNIRRLATIEKSINTSLLYDREKNESSCKNTLSYIDTLRYIITGAIIVMVIIVLIIVILRNVI